ncbi:MAG TPA: hypothetical protein VN253_29565 [Kofleriaceae bacterium]|nr:hypothetical protein [Kofleriaceae bacterium]
MLSAIERRALLKMLDALEPPADGVSVTFTLAPIWRDSEDYRMGWMACVSEIKSVLLPMLGFAREYWDRRRKAHSKDMSKRRQARIDAGMCEVWTCQEPATDGTMCGPHADKRRDRVAQQVRERRDRNLAALTDRARLQSLRPKRWSDENGGNK